MSEANDFNIESMLTTTEFTIPVTIEEPPINGGKPIKRTINVTYNFDDGISKRFADGKPNPDYEKEQPRLSELFAALEGDELKRAKLNNPLPPEKTTLNINEQLALVVTKINGVEAVPTVEWWEKVRFKYRTNILEQVLRDVYPNVAISKG